MSSLPGTIFAHLRLKLWVRRLEPHFHQPSVPELAIKTERFEGHHEAREALVLSVASVTAIMLTAYLILLILY